MYVEIELDDKNKRIRYDYNMVADLEEKAGAGLMTLVSDERMGFSTIRLLLWAGLKWEDRGLTLQRTGMMLQKYIEDGGDLVEIANACIKALNKSGLLGKDEGNEMTEAAN